MGVERISVTAKLDMEVVVWIEALRRHVFPWLTRSAAINEVLGCIRRASMANDLSRTARFWQEIDRLYRTEGTRITCPVCQCPVIGPKSVGAPAPKEKSA